MANNNYKIHPYAAREDVSEQRLATVRHDQKQHQQYRQYQYQHHHQHQHQHQYQHHHQQQPQQEPMQRLFSSGPGAHHYPKACFPNPNFQQKTVVKSTLNPNAKEFYPSYLEHAKNGFSNQTYRNVMNAFGPEYGHWPDCEYEHRYLTPARYMRGQRVQRSNSLLAIIPDTYSGSASTNFYSKSTSCQNSSSHIDNKHSNTRSSTNTTDSDPTFSESERLKSGEKVWFIDKGLETAKVDSTETWSSRELIDDTMSQEEFYDAEIAWNDASKTNNSQKDSSESKVEEKKPEKKDDCVEEDTTGGNAGKKLIMLYPSKKQPETIIDSSRESIFGEPNAINYTSDESFLQCCNDDASEMHKDGKLLNEEIDRTEDDSEDFERTVKQNTSKSDVILYRDTSDYSLEQRMEKAPLKSKLVGHEAEMKTQKKFETRGKPVKMSSSELLQKYCMLESQKAQALKKEAAAAKNKKIVSNSTSSKVESSKLQPRSAAVKTTKFSSGSTSVKPTETTTTAKTTTTMTTAKSSTTGAIPKTKEIMFRTTKKLPSLSTEESSSKTTRTLPFKSNPMKKEEKTIETRGVRMPNGYFGSRPSTNSSTRRFDAINSSNNNSNHTEVKSIVKPEPSIRKPLASAIKSTDGYSSAHPKQVKMSPSTYLNTLTKATHLLTMATTTRSATMAKKEKVTTIKSIVKTQMQTPPPINTTSNPPTKKVLVINNVSKKSNDLIKARTKTATANNRSSATTKPTAAAAAAAAASTKIPVKHKSNSLKGVNAVIGSDGDNLKIQTSRSCTSLRKNIKYLPKTSSNASIKIGDKLSESKQKTPTSATSNHLASRHSPTKKLFSTSHW